MTRYIVDRNGCIRINSQLLQFYQVFQVALTTLCFDPTAVHDSSLGVCPFLIRITELIEMLSN